MIGKLKAKAKVGLVMANCDWCKSPEVVTNLDGDNLCQSCANKWVEGEAPEPHNCSYSTSRLTGSSGDIGYFTCECGEEWEKDVS